MPEAQITTAARRLARQHNALPAHYSGAIVRADLAGNINAAIVATYAVAQRSREEITRDGWFYIRIGHGRMTYTEAQHTLDNPQEA